MTDAERLRIAQDRVKDAAAALDDELGPAMMEDAARLLVQAMDAIGYKPTPISVASLSDEIPALSDLPWGLRGEGRQVIVSTGVLALKLAAPIFMLLVLVALAACVVFGIPAIWNGVEGLMS